MRQDGGSKDFIGARNEYYATLRDNAMVSSGSCGWHIRRSRDSLNRDLFMVGGVVIVYSMLLIVFNLVVDALYTLLDRRIRLT